MPELDVRGTPAWQVRQYLTELGGSEEPNGAVTGPGWRATLTEGVHVAFGTELPRVIVRIEGEPGAAQDLYARLRLRVMRVGG